MHFEKGYKPTCKLGFLHIRHNGVIIDRVESFKYLGIWIDSRLKFNVHLNACIRNASHKIYLLQRIRNSVDKRTANIIYKSMILSLIEYGNCFLLGCTAAERTKLQRIQNKGLKIVFERARLYNTRLLHKEANLASWEVRALVAASRLMFKYKFLPSNIELNRPGTGSQTGPIFKIDRPNARSIIISLSYRLRDIWNKLPPSLRNIDDQEHFNMAVKRFHTTRYFESI